MVVSGTKELKRIVVIRSPMLHAKRMGRLPLGRFVEKIAREKADVMRAHYESVINEVADDPSAHLHFTLPTRDLEAYARSRIPGNRLSFSDDYTRIIDRIKDTPTERIMVDVRGEFATQCAAIEVMSLLESLKWAGHKVPWKNVRIRADYSFTSDALSGGNVERLTKPLFEHCIEREKRMLVKTIKSGLRSFVDPEEIIFDLKESRENEEATAEDIASRWMSDREFKKLRLFYENVRHKQLLADAKKVGLTDEQLEKARKTGALSKAMKEMYAVEEQVMKDLMPEYKHLNPNKIFELNNVIKKKTYRKRKQLLEQLKQA